MCAGGPVRDGDRGERARLHLTAGHQSANSADMASDAPDTVQVDHDAEPELPPPTDIEPAQREWYESPWLWAAGVVVLLLSIPLLLEVTSGGRKAAATSKPLADPAALAASEAAAAPVAEPTAAAPVTSFESPRAAEGGPPPRATPPSVVPRPPEPARQMVIKCMEKGGRIVYTQTGACTGSMVPVPIDADKNVVDSSTLPPRAAASR